MISELGWRWEHRSVCFVQHAYTLVEPLGGQIADREYRRVLTFLTARLLEESPTVANHPDGVDRRRPRHRRAFLNLPERKFFVFVVPADCLSKQIEQHADRGVRNVRVGHDLVEDEVRNWRGVREEERPQIPLRRFRAL